MVLDGEPAVAVGDQTEALQAGRDGRHRRAAQTQHGRQQLLGQRKRAAADLVRAAQQPLRAALLSGVPLGAGNPAADQHALRRATD